MKSVACVVLFCFMSPEVIYLLPGVGEIHTTVVYALINKKTELKDGVLSFSHDCKTQML